MSKVFNDVEGAVRSVEIELRKRDKRETAQKYKRKQKEIKRTVNAPLIITFSPANPNFRKWINEEIALLILHEEPKLGRKCYQRLM